MPLALGVQRLIGLGQYQECMLVNHFVRPNSLKIQQQVCVYCVQRLSVKHCRCSQVCKHGI
jgi:hypothetical protein